MGSSIRTIILAGIAALGIYLGYKYLLTPQAKENIKNAAQRGVQFGLDMHDKVKGSAEVDEQSRIESNQAFVADQWKQAGF